MTATLAERAAALAARGIVPPSHRSPEPCFDANGWRWRPVVGQGWSWRGWLLDLEDDGNKGRLLGAVRKAWGMPHLSPMFDDGWCFWWPGDDDRGDQWPIGEGIGKCATEAELFVAALERAS